MLVLRVDTETGSLDDVMPVAWSPSRRRQRRDGSANTAVAVDPGVLDTELARKYLIGELQLLPGPLQWLVRPLWVAAVPWLMLPPQTAAETMLYASTAPAEKVRTLQLNCLEPCCQRAQAAKACKDALSCSTIAGGQTAFKAISGSC